MPETFGIGVAVEFMKKGEKVARIGWYDKGLFLYYVPGEFYDPYTKIAKELVNDDGKVPYAPYVAMKTVNGKVVPWLCSQTDLLATDWYIV